MPRKMQVGYFLDGSETLEQVVLRLRYGSHDPVMNQIPIGIRIQAEYNIRVALVIAQPPGNTYAHS